MQTNGISAVSTVSSISTAFPNFHMILTARYQPTKAETKERRCVALRCSLHKIKVHTLQIITAHSLFNRFFRLFVTAFVLYKCHLLY